MTIAYPYVVPAQAAGVSAKSLVLTNAGSQYLSKTWGANPVDATKLTLAFWCKFVGGLPPNNQYFYDGGFGGSKYFAVRNSSFDVNQWTIVQDDGTVITITFNVTADTAWHHVCFVADSTQATATDRMKIYVDGIEPSYGTHATIAQNASNHATDNGATTLIGSVYFNLANSPDAKLAYYYLIDGQVLTPSSFTTGTGAGTIHPATYGGTYSGNSFFLNFSASDGADSSGLGNNWTPVNTPTYDTDLPT